MIVLVGWTSCGKSTVEKELVNTYGLSRIISYTTRPPRTKVGEINGVDYHFVSEEDFEDKLKNGFFAEKTQYNTVDGVWKYASAKEDINDTKICVLNPDGLRQLKEHNNLNIISFYIKVDEETLKNSLSKRGDKKAEYERRLESDRSDFKGIEDKVDFVIKNDGYGKTPMEMATIIYVLSKVKEDE